MGCLRCCQGRDYLPNPASRAGVRQAQYPRELHSSGYHHDPHEREAVRRGRGSRGSHRNLEQDAPHWPIRTAGRGRGGGPVPRLRRVLLRHRPLLSGGRRALCQSRVGKGCKNNGSGSFGGRKDNRLHPDDGWPLGDADARRSRGRGHKDRTHQYRRMGTRTRLHGGTTRWRQPILPRYEPQQEEPEP